MVFLIKIQKETSLFSVVLWQVVLMPLSSISFQQNVPGVSAYEASADL